MAGHSQFKNIMHRKGAQDRKRGRIFSRLSREITVAARLGGADPDGNPRLRLAIQEARGQNMPKDNIQRAVGKAEGGDAADYQEVLYEGYGPGGVGFVVEALTDNRNRTAASIRARFSKGGGTLAEGGAVIFMFDRLGEIVFPPATAKVEAVLEAAIEAGAEDVASDADGHRIFCSRGNLGEAARVLEERLGAAPERARLIWWPRDGIPVEGADAEKAAVLFESLNEDDDVQAVYTNFEMTDEVFARSVA